MKKRRIILAALAAYLLALVGWRVPVVYGQEARLTARGLVIPHALGVSVYAHSLETLVWYDPASRCAAYDYVPGELPTITMAAGELKHSRDPILLDHKSEPKPRWFGGYERGWWWVEDLVIDFSTANYGAHVAWQEEYIPEPGYFCGGPHDVTFDLRTNMYDVQYMQYLVMQRDDRGDWNEDGTVDEIDFLEFLEGF